MTTLKEMIRKKIQNRKAKLLHMSVWKIAIPTFASLTVVNNV